MLYEIKHRVAAELAAQGCPLPVEYGPERSDSPNLAQSRCVFERDRNAGDSSGPGRARTINPRMLKVRAVGCVCTLYAQSTDVGAGVHDHEHLADHMLDMVEVALEKVIRGLPTLWRITSSKFLTAEEINARGLQVWPGVVYELRFQVDRGVFDTTWEYEAKREFTVDEGSIQNTTQVRLPGPDSAPEVACGEP